MEMHLQDSNAVERPTTEELLDKQLRALVGFLAKVSFASIPGAIILYVAAFSVLFLLWVVVSIMGLSLPLPF